ncbi:MAG TPA: hypothetical protein PKI05_08190 [Thermogutta sp.]|nr:hypothetical protein [Thermogutta sp.]
MSYTPYLTCEAHGRQIATALPPDCPMKEQASYRALTSLLDEGFKLIDPQTPETIAHGLWLVRRGQDTCYSCIGRLVKHPTIKHIRDDQQAKERYAATVGRPSKSVEHLPPINDKAKARDQSPKPDWMKPNVAPVQPANKVEWRAPA